MPKTGTFTPSLRFPRGPATPVATAAVAALCCVAVGLVVAAPLFAASGGRAASLLYELFAPVCHQIAERSFHLAGQPLAVCHRCFGFYVGFTAGMIAMLPAAATLAAPVRDWLLERPRRILLLLAPTAIDWLLLPWNVPASRFTTAVVAAAPIAVLVWAAIVQVVQSSTRAARAPSPKGKPRETP